MSFGDIHVCESQKTWAMSATSFTSPGHVDALTSGYKRSFNSIGPVAVGEFKRPASMPASALRNDRGTNATLSVARCCSIPLYPGEVAFVRTGKGLRSLGEGTNFIPIVSLSQINEMLLDNPVTPMSGARSVAANLLTTKVSKSVFGRVNSNPAAPLQYAEFDPVKMTDDLSHPLHAYALDGVVCSANDSRGGQGDRRGYTTREEAAGCNVAVGGQSPLVAVSMKGQAARMTSRVYVVLVANRVVSGAARPRRATPHSPFLTGASASAMNQSFFSTDASTTPPYGTSASSMIGTEWVFQYELVTSAELDIDPAFRKFKVESISTRTSNRVPVKMWQLGVVTDLNSGHQSLPTQFTVSVNVRPFHGVQTRAHESVDGNMLWVKLPPSRGGPRIVFFPPTKAELRNQKANYMLPANDYFRRMRGHRTCFNRGMPKNCGFTTAVTGPSAADFKLFEDRMKSMQDAFQNKMNAQLKDAKIRLKAAEAAAKAAAEAAKQLTNPTNTLGVDEKIKAVRKRVDEHDKIIEEVKASVENVRQTSLENSEGLITTVRKVNTVANEAAKLAKSVAASDASQNEGIVKVRKRVDEHGKIIEEVKASVENVRQTSLENSEGLITTVRQVNRDAEEVRGRVDEHGETIKNARLDIDRNSTRVQEAVEAANAAVEAARSAVEAARSADNLGQALAVDNDVTKKQALARTNEVNEKLGQLQESVRDNNTNGLNSLQEIQQLKTQIGVDWQQQQVKTLAVLEALRQDVNKLGPELRAEIYLLTDSMIEIKRQIEELTASGSNEKQIELTEKLDKLNGVIFGLSANKEANKEVVGELGKTLDILKVRFEALLREIEEAQETTGKTLLANVKELLEAAFSEPSATPSALEEGSEAAENAVGKLLDNGTNRTELGDTLSQYLNRMQEIEKVDGTDTDDPRKVAFEWLGKSIEEIEKLDNSIYEPVRVPAQP